MSQPQTECFSVQPPSKVAVIGTPNILMADDNAELLHAASGALKRAGYAVTTVSNGTAAWEILNNHNFDLLLTDEQMPGLTGCELIAKARQYQLTLPIILMSGQTDFLLNPKYKTLQGAQLLQKPFDLRVLIEAVTRALSSTPEAAPSFNSDRAQTAELPSA